MICPFHLAIPVTDLQASKRFYQEHIGCEMGRSSEQWIDWNFFGHQLVTHLVNEMPSGDNANQVDSKSVPVPHFGLVLPKAEWETLASRLQSAGYTFHISPYIRFKGEVGEQGTFFLFDPSGNALEFKYFEDMSQLFAS
ncbi:VOC family protein [Glaciecola sp. XM2]|jgi:extradiol dioxygenase family protein|uniref:VOC family protein n=1 Tax=Glaciecola sp. XM2 TaxID=1914931 RepID=UPI001BDF3278|nr:VOC family protein [Glaciecola sp. XM2]MBT1452230.1 VOC family protein [Glaciecola sp. XM2]